MDKPLKSVTHGQCDARPTATFPAAGHHRPLTGAKLYCLVTEAHVCEQLAQDCYLKAERPGVEPATSRVASRNYLRGPTSNAKDRKGERRGRKEPNGWKWSGRGQHSLARPLI